jgi:hypothetical protein
MESIRLSASLTGDGTFRLGNNRSLTQGIAQSKTQTSLNQETLQSGFAAGIQNSTAGTQAVSSSADFTVSTDLTSAVIDEVPSDTVARTVSSEIVITGPVAILNEIAVIMPSAGLEKSRENQSSLVKNEEANADPAQSGLNLETSQQNLSGSAVPQASGDFEASRTTPQPVTPAASRSATPRPAASPASSRPVTVEPQQVLPASRQIPANTPDPEEISTKKPEGTGEFPEISFENSNGYSEKILSNALPDTVYQTEVVVAR